MHAYMFKLEFCLALALSTIYTLVFLLLLLLAAMTYNQVQSFQINDYANHYVDVEVTIECCTAKLLQAGA